ncbi:squalene cyclase, partial [Arthrobacter sp. HMWF013]|uniref:squalene cyclase n=1 Tax=Arthrobacter sp. HMWF013 TaxID=2056849 RepID=UPI00215A0741
MAVDPAVLDWMLDSDPALRWQVQQDIAGEPPEVWEATRARTATEGFGARLLALQDPDGQWAGGAYFPQDFDFDGPQAAEDAGQPWTATTWSLNALRDWGLDAAALTGTAELLAVNSRWEYNDLPYWGGEVDCCINAFTLANGVWLGADVAGIAQWFLDHQMADGGWNCEWVEGSRRSSFHSTINVLKGLLYYEAATGGSSELRAARRTGEEYLLKRQLLYSRSTGELVGPWVARFVYPSRAFYNA